MLITACTYTLITSQHNDEIREIQRMGDKFKKNVFTKADTVPS